MWKHAASPGDEGMICLRDIHADHLVLCQFTYVVSTFSEVNAAQSSARRLIPYFWEIDKTISSKSIESNPSPSPNNGAAGSTSWGLISKCKVATSNRAISISDILSIVASFSICADMAIRSPRSTCVLRRFRLGRPHAGARLARFPVRCRRTIFYSMEGQPSLPRR